MTWFWLGGSTLGAAADDSKELLAQLRVVTNRPDTDRDLTDAKGYVFLTHAQTSLLYTLASHIPNTLKGAPEKMTTADSGATYTHANEAIGQVEIYPSKTTRLALVEGPYWDDRADYVREGPKTIRLFTPRTFVDGPYARYIAKPGVIDTASQPTILPLDVRRVLPWQAAGMWAAAGNIEDPTGYFTMVEHMLWGDPNSPGSVGLIPAYKLQDFTSGISGEPGVGQLWWRSLGGQA